MPTPGTQAEHAQDQDIPRAIPVQEGPAPKAVPVDAAMANNAAACSLKDGKAATQPGAELGDAPIPGEEAWLMTAMKYNRRQDLTRTQWTAIQRHMKTGDDGTPGKSTARAIFRWQQAQQLTPDGKMGPGTLLAIKNDQCPIPKAKEPEKEAEEGSQTEPEKETEEETSTGGGDAEQQTTDPKAQKRNPTMATDRVQFLKVLDQVTSVMETGEQKGDYALLHTLNDGGGISFGKHQVTLTSGTLYKLLATYLQVASKDSANAKILRPYLARTKKMDKSLIRDKKYLAALRAAGAEKEMKQAQDMTFLEVYGKKAFSVSKTNKVSSVLGHAIMYDTKIQGGLETLIARTRKQLGGSVGDEIKGVKITEKEFLSVFNDLREKRLYNLAAIAKNKGKHKRAEMLSNSTYRCRGFRELLEAGNLNVAGPKGKVKIKGPGGDSYTVDGFDDKEVEGSTVAAELAKLKVIGNAKITGNNLNVRSGPSGGHRKIDQVKNGEEYEVVEQKSGWLRIKMANKAGWISGDYASFQAVAKTADQDVE